MEYRATAFDNADEPRSGVQIPISQVEPAPDVRALPTDCSGRRRFLGLAPALGAIALTGSTSWASHREQPRESTASSHQGPESIPAGFPRHGLDAVHDIVLKSHFDLEHVTNAVTARPALAKAAIDHGYGDWESAIGAASHTGRRAIAEVLIAHGARPTHFTFAMLGDVDAVRAMVGSRPELRSLLGPHGISLMGHARAGGDEARGVLAYLEELGDADPQEPRQTMAAEQMLRYTGEYRYGQGPDERLIVEVRRDELAVSTPGTFPRTLRWQGGDVFTPQGSVAVRLVLGGLGEQAQRLTVHDPEPIADGVRI